MTFTEAIEAALRDLLANKDAPKVGVRPEVPLYVLHTGNVARMAHAVAGAESLRPWAEVSAGDPERLQPRCMEALVGGSHVDRCVRLDEHDMPHVDWHGCVWREGIGTRVELAEIVSFDRGRDSADGASS